MLFAAAREDALAAVSAVAARRGCSCRVSFDLRLHDEVVEVEASAEEGPLADVLVLVGVQTAASALAAALPGRRMDIRAALLPKV